jgi:hypothetical protein
MRQDRFVALRAILNLDRLNVLMTPPFALPGMGRASLWDSHVSLPFVKFVVP